MAVAGKTARSYPIPGRAVVFATYAASIVLLAVAVLLLAPRLSAPVLALGLAGYLFLVGVLAVQLLHRAGRRRTHWQNVMPCYLSVQDANLRIVETNEKFRRDFGDRVGEQCHWVYKRSDRPCANCPVLATFRDGLIHTGEETVITQDGQAAQVVVTSAPHYDKQGNMVGVVEMSTNVTELKKLQHELELTRVEYERLFDLVPCYISVQDRDFNIVECNELVRRDFGEALGQRCYSVYKRCESLCPDCVVEKSFQSGQVFSSEEISTTQDGRTLNLITYSMPIRDERGEITRVMEVATDITEVKQLQKELTLIGRAVAGMAHRIKNILMGLEGGLFVVNTAFARNDAAAVAQGWEMIERNVERVSHIVKDLLYCSKKREPEFKENVAAENLAREVGELFAGRTAKDDIDLQVEVGPSRPRTLHPDGVHSLITNLVTNAIDACRFDPDESKERHTITLRCGTDPAGVTTIEVADDGAGIPEEVADKVFQDFFSTKGTEGTGLGLLIINRVVEEHGGEITYRSTPGRGTTFTVTLPPLPAPIPAGAEDLS